MSPILKTLFHRRQVLPALALILVVFVWDANAEAAEVPRPKVCLVLSGGGARGAAHVGVIKVLEALRVPIDCIAGTSMGALVGGAYASGNSIGEMEKMIEGISTALLFNDKLPRREQTMRRKQEDLTNLVGPELGFRDGEFLWPKGFVSGIRVEMVLRRLVRVYGAPRFDDLPIPFRAVATDLATGKAVVFAEGELANAMRASMSVPGLIAPAEFDGMTLVDGGLTNNLPVDVAREMGADIVIAVNLGTPLLKPEALGSVLGTSAQMVNILTEQNVQASLASLTPTDILIAPELGDFFFGDFDNMSKTFPIGEAAARKVADRLSALSLSAPEYRALRERQGVEAPLGLPAVDEIRFAGLRRVNPRVAAALMETRTDQAIDTEVLDLDIQRLYGTGYFEHVGYRFLEEEGRRVLAVEAVEKSWGPGYLRFGLSLNSDFRGEASYQLLAQYRRTWINPLGAEWRSHLQIGRADSLYTEFYQPLEVTHTFFVVPYFQAERRPIDLFEGNQRIARYEIRSSLAGFDLGAQMTTFGEVRVGLLFGRARASLDTGPDTLAPDDSSGTLGALHTRFFVDQLDSVIFPRAGYDLVLEVVNAREALGSDATSNRWDINGTVVHSFGDHTLHVGYRFGGSYGASSASSADLIQWGGFLAQSGYRTGALAGESISFGRLLYYRKLVRQTLLEGLYAGFSLEAGEVRKPVIADSRVGLLKSGSLFLALDTLLGPLYLAYGRTTDGIYSYYLFLGRP